MDKVNILDYKSIYLETAKKYAVSLSESCIDLENNPLDKNALSKLHISSHSLRSQSQVMNYTGISKVTGAIEKIAKAILEEKYKINKRIISLLKKAIIEVNLLLGDIESQSKERNVDYLLKKLENVS